MDGSVGEAPVGRTWVVVLAAGEGRRLARLTTTASGTSVPKQFCSLWGGSPLLQDAIQRARGLTRRERICAVVAAQHWQWWEPLLWALPLQNTIVQPENRGTAIGVLLSLLHVEQRCADAQVVLLPSDHHIRDEALFAAALKKANADAARHPEAVVLLGLQPEEPSTELGYIVPRPDADADAPAMVERFVEKPDAALAEQLIARGALWNTFVVCGSVRALLGLYESRHAELVARLRAAVRHDTDPHNERSETHRVYRTLATLDFSHDLLRGQEDRLRVHAVPACGWSDLGCVHTVARVLASGRRAPRQRLRTGLPPAVTLSIQHAKLLGTALDSSGAVA